MSPRRTGDGRVGNGYGEETRIGTAYECAQDESEFGLPAGFDDPNAYHGKSPACEPKIGVSRQ